MNLILNFGLSWATANADVGREPPSGIYITFELYSIDVWGWNPLLEILNTAFVIHRDLHLGLNIGQALQSLTLIILVN